MKKVAELFEGNKKVQFLMGTEVSSPTSRPTHITYSHSSNIMEVTASQRPKGKESRRGRQENQESHPYKPGRKALSRQDKIFPSVRACTS